MSSSKALDIHLRSTFKIPFAQKEATGGGPYKIYDVKFYPFQAKASSVFALVGVRHIFICRTPTNPEESLIILHTLHDLEDLPETGPDILNSCEWNYITPSQPLLSVAGVSGLIKVFNALTGTELTTLVGHGIGIINDLSTHPLYPSIIASGSMDSSIRIWDIRRTITTPSKPPCIIICGHSQGHHEGVLTISWHPRGRYLISGAHDYMICVWTIPDLSDSSPFWSEMANPRRTAEKVRVIHYPHFISSALHSNYVDCVQFYGDLVLSKAAEDNKIVIWRIEGFNSRMMPPGDDAAPKTREYLDTRNGFATKPKPSNDSDDEEASIGYARLLEFSIPDSELFYMRFALLAPSPTYPTHPTILTFANLRSRVFFWDLQALETGRTNPKKTSPENFDSDEDDGPDRARYPISDPHTPIPAHMEVGIPDFKSKGVLFQGRGVAWSPDGRWCVVVGESGGPGREEGVGAIFERTIERNEPELREEEGRG